MSGAPADRKSVVEALLNRSRPLAEIRAELGQFPWDSEPLVQLTREHVGNVLRAFLAGEIDALSIEDWANLIEMRDDIGFEDEDEDADDFEHGDLRNAIFVLANPVLYGDLTKDLARQLLEEIGVRGLGMASETRRIVLDVTGCTTTAELNEAAAKVLGAPDWHGRNLDAWWDSLRSDDINEVRAPYTIVIRGSRTVPADLAEYVRRFASLFDDARAEYGISIYCVLGVGPNWD
jgi:RNAse (barnase) inhibitor barstar